MGLDVDARSLVGLHVRPVQAVQPGPNRREGRIHTQDDRDIGLC